MGHFLAPSGGGSVQSTPNVTPMIDVMLVLLIIFMVVTPMLLAGFQRRPAVQGTTNLEDHPEDQTDQSCSGSTKTGNYYRSTRSRSKSASTLVRHSSRPIRPAHRKTSKVMYLKVTRIFPTGRFSTPRSGDQERRRIDRSHQRTENGTTNVVTAGDSKYGPPPAAGEGSNYGNVPGAKKARERHQRHTDDRRAPLVLLIIFMAALPSMLQAIDVQLPDPTPSVAPANQKK